MPYRCTNCQHLSKEDDNAQCKTRQNCNFERVEVIHLAHPEGSGRVVGMGTKEVLDENNSVTVATEMRLCCTSSAPYAAFTNARYAATCIDCLTNRPEEPTNMPEQS